MAGKTDFTAETEDGLRQNGTLSLAGWSISLSHRSFLRIN